MPKNNKKQINQKPEPVATQSSISSSLNRLFKKVTSIRPSTLIVSIIIIGYTVFLLGGGIFTVTRDGILPVTYYNDRFLFLFPSISDQFIADTVISVMLYLMGFAGLLSIYQSTKNVNKPRQAYMLMAIGISLTLLSYVFIESAIGIKVKGLM